MRKTILFAAAALLLAITQPARAQFCPGVSPWVFDDVPASDPFCSYITWMAQNGISLGCQIIDANHRLYCPNANVTRAAMAAFMNRLGSSSGPNLNLQDSTSTAGNILKPGGVFLHNSGVDNTFLGVTAGNFVVAGTGNTGLGISALTSITTGVDNTATGTRALGFNTTGYRNSAHGFQALMGNTVGTLNTAMGAYALEANSGGNQNSAAGAFAMRLNTTGSSNTAHGYQALYNNTTGAFNTAVGAGAMPNNSTASRSTAVGNNALNLSNADYNTAVGSDALANNTTGTNNTGIGAYALEHNTTGYDNTASGLGALRLNTTGRWNVAMGRSALGASTTAEGNVGVGFNALSSFTGTGKNVAVGQSALSALTSGWGNVAVGDGALTQVNGIWNIAIGSLAGSDVVAGSNNIYIGNSTGSANESNTTRIGVFAMSDRTFIAGIRGVTTGVNNAVNVVIDGNGQLGTLSSSREVKNDIEDMGDASEVLMKLHPVTFRYKAHGDSGGKQYGLIAEEVAEVAPELAAAGRDGQIETVFYQHLAPMLVNEYQKQRHTIEAQARIIADQAHRMEDQDAKIAELRRAVEVLMARTSPDGRLAAK